MLRAAVVAVLMVGCGQMTVERGERWPAHRKRHDGALESLEITMKQQAREIVLLQRRLAKLELAQQAPAHVEPAPATQPASP
ncbi:MAG: hypothetical protein IPQ07_24850 [Myxococcales bacterium]|nr:hypothetical protein [Myxococcales bacterium]